MLRSRKFWIPSLIALLTLAGAVLAATDTRIGPYPMVVRGRPAPWWDGAFFAVVGLWATLTSLWWFYLPDWEREHASLRTVVAVGHRRIPVLMFPYSVSLPVFLIIMAVLIIGVSAIGNPLFLLMLALPVLAFVIRVVFGRQFVGLTPEGLVWRVMPTGPSRGGSDLRGSDVFTHQPVQFLPWSAIAGVSLADVVPAAPESVRSGKSVRAFLALRVSVSDPRALEGLTHYQRVVPTAAGADVLIPMDRHGPSERIAMFGEGLTRAEPEAVLASVEHYLRHPEERDQIRSALGGIRSQGRSDAEAPVPAVETVRDPSGQEPRAAAQRVGDRAAKTGHTIGGAVLGVPYFAVALGLMFSGHLPGPASLFFPVTIGYLLLVVLPGSAAVSCALAAFAAPTGQEAAYARVSMFDYVFSVVFMAVVMLALSAWQYFDPANPGKTTISAPLILVALILTLLGLSLGILAGLRAGRAAKAGDPVWLARLLERWSR